MYLVMRPGTGRDTIMVAKPTQALKAARSCISLMQYNTAIGGNTYLQPKIWCKKIIHNMIWNGDSIAAKAQCQFPYNLAARCKI